MRAIRGKLEKKVSWSTIRSIPRCNTYTFIPAVGVFKSTSFKRTITWVVRGNSMTMPKLLSTGIDVLDEPVVLAEDRRGREMWALRHIVRRLRVLIKKGARLVDLERWIAQSIQRALWVCLGITLFNILYPGRIALDASSIDAWAHTRLLARFLLLGLSSTGRK